MVAIRPLTNITSGIIATLNCREQNTSQTTIKHNKLTLYSPNESYIYSGLYT